jgi:hypothetical protein
MGSGAVMKLPVRFRVTWLSRSQHLSHGVAWSLSLHPVENAEGNSANGLTFHLEGEELPEQFALGREFELTAVPGTPDGVLISKRTWELGGR